MEPIEREAREAEAAARETYKLAEDFSSFDVPADPAPQPPRE
jgi:hypothetical protein